MRIAASLIAALALGACAADAQEGNPDMTMTQRSFDLAGFDSVSLAGAHKVIVTVGPAHSVRAEGPASVLERLEIAVDDGDLEIRQKKGSFSTGFGRNTPETTIYVTLPAMQAAAIGGSGDMRIDKVEGRDFAASIAGSGDIEVASLRVEQASFSIAGSGGISATGAVGKSNVAIKGSGEVSLDRLESRTASVSVMGSGDVRVRAIETADVSIMGSGDVTVGGGAKCSVSKRGSGDVRCVA